MTFSLAEIAQRAGHAYVRSLVALTDACLRRPGRVLAAAALITFALAYHTAGHLTINTNTLDMLDPDLPFRKLDREFVRAFPQLSNLAVAVIDAESPAHAQRAANQLATRLQQDRALFNTVYVPGQGDLFARNGLLYLETQELWDLTERLAPAQPIIATLAGDPSLRGFFSVLGRALDQPLTEHDEQVLGELFDRIRRAVEAQLEGVRTRISWRAELFPGGSSADSRSFILMQPRLDYASLDPAAEAIATIRRLATQLDSEGVRVRLTGPVVMDSEEIASVARDGSIATVLALGLVCALLLVGLRSLRLTVAVLATLFVGLVWTAAFAALVFGSLNLISITFAVLFIGLGVDFGIQFAMRYREEIEEDRGAALRSTVLHLAPALTLAAAVAALAFFALAPTSYRGLAELGMISGVAMGFALIANLTVLPALLAVLSEPSRRARDEVRWLASAMATSQNHRRAVLGGAVLIALTAAALLPRARFDFNPLNLKDPATESVATFRELAAHPDSTPYTIDVLAPSLAAAQTLVTRLEALEVVDKALTLASYVPDDQEAKRQAIADLKLMLGPGVARPEQKAPPTVEEQLAAIAAFESKLGGPDNAASTEFDTSAAKLRAALDRLKALPGWPQTALPELQSRVIGDLPETLGQFRGMLDPAPVGINDIPSELRERYIAADGRARIEVFPKQDIAGSAAMRRFVRAVQQLAPNAIGAPVELVESADAVILACLQATALALIATVALLALVMRSVVDALLVIVPLLLALALTLASSVLFDLPFNFANIIALPLLVALNNAFGIYLVTRRRTGIDFAALFKSSTPRAVLFSGLTTLVSFGALAVANHPGISSMGVLIALSLSYALAATLIVLPALMAEIACARSKR